jgi:hypothetical protein
VPGNRKNDGVWAKHKSKVEPIQKSKFAPKIIVWGAMTASGVSKIHVLAPNQTVRAKYNQESILSLFLPDEMKKTRDTGKVTARRFMKTCSIDIVAGRSTSSQGHRNSKADLKQFFLNFKSKTNDPQTCLTCRS